MTHQLDKCDVEKFVHTWQEKETVHYSCILDKVRTRRAAAAERRERASQSQSQQHGQNPANCLLVMGRVVHAPDYCSNRIYKEGNKQKDWRFGWLLKWGDRVCNDWCCPKKC
jgi:hypothetical protein